MTAIKVAVISAGGLSAMVVVAGVQMGLLAAENELKAEAVADANGNLHVPDAYRTTYQFLGTWAVAADQGHGSAELHVVYASPGTITAFRKDEHFPDGAVLVKEVYRAATPVNCASNTLPPRRFSTRRGWRWRRLSSA